MFSSRPDQMSSQRRVLTPSQSQRRALTPSQSHIARERREQDDFEQEAAGGHSDDGGRVSRSQSQRSLSRQRDLESDEETSAVGQYPASSYRAGEKGRSPRRLPKRMDTQMPQLSGSLLLVSIIIASLVGTYFLAQQVRAKALNLAVAKDMNTALATELEESRSGASALSKQLKNLEDALYQAREKCARDIKKLDVTLDQLRQNTTKTANQLKNEKLITAKLIQENEVYQKKLQAANSVSAKTITSDKRKLQAADSTLTTTVSPLLRGKPS